VKLRVRMRLREKKKPKVNDSKKNWQTEKWMLKGKKSPKETQTAIPR